MSTSDEALTALAAPLPPPLLAWVDRVGCFQLLPGRKWRLGGPGGEPPADVVICGDLSRREAEIQRRGSRYVLQRAASTAAAGNPSDIALAVELLPHKQFTLGKRRDIVIEFQRPHPLSASATLRCLSRHRTAPACTGIVLVADTCMLGASESAHIVCQDAIDSLMILVGSDGSWQAKANATFAIDRQSFRGVTKLSFPCRIELGETVVALERFEPSAAI